MRIIYYTILLFLCAASLNTYAQKENTAIRKGNKFYKKGEFDKALPEYQRAATQNPDNPVARYNLGNAAFRNKKYADAEQAFEAAIANANTKAFKQKSYYNAGVALIKEQKLAESIEAWKNALKLDPTDDDARFNLQKALSELRKQNQSGQQKQQQNQQPSNKRQKKPQPREKDLDKRKIEQYLEALRQKEQEVQRKIQQSRSRSVTRPEKDW